VHPIVVKELIEWVTKVRDKKGIYIAEVPLLFEKKLEKHFESIILVKTKKRVLMERLKEKYNFSNSQVKERLALQLPVKHKEKRSNFLVNNDFDLKRLQKEVGLLWKKIK